MGEVQTDGRLAPIDCGMIFIRIVSHGYSVPQRFEGAVYLDHLSEMVKEWDVLKAGFAREISHRARHNFCA
jgi:hypothetical protein